MQNKIDVIILSYNAKISLDRLIRSIFLNTDKRKINLTIVDNNSEKETMDFLLETYPLSNLILLNENKFFSGGANVGLRYATSDLVVLFTNDTAVYDKDWLEYMVSVFDDNPALGLLSMNYLNKPDLGGRDSENYKYYEIGPLHYACGMAFMARKCALEEVGYFDEDEHPIYGSDVILSVALRYKGWKIFRTNHPTIGHFGNPATNHLRRTRPDFWSRYIKKSNKWNAEYLIDNAALKPDAAQKIIDNQIERGRVTIQFIGIENSVVYNEKERL